MKTSIICRIILVAVSSICLTSCYTLRDKTLLQESKSLPKYKPTAYEDYKLRVNDELLFRIISTDEDFVSMITAGLSSSQQDAISYRIFPDGTVELPFISAVKVEGLTLDEATKILRKQYLQIVNDADIRLALANKSFTMIGEAGNGIYPIYKERMTIYQALAQSGEINLSGDRKHVRIIREKEEGVEILEFDIRPKTVIDSKYYYIYPNDIIYVQKENASFYKTNNYSSFLSLITSSISLFTTVYYYYHYSK